MGEQRLKLLIAIPALNEEEAIAPIIERSLAARATIIEKSPVTEVDITVVSDGSTDRTVERARAFGDRIKLIVFEKNQGYGAAIQAAWSASDAELVSFLDADGTCDPLYFAPLCQLLEAEKADVVLGCRLTAESKMPVLRRVGNVIFALLLTFFASKRVRDTASGMRVVRRSSLPKLLPLPTGMHFTPAMSARAILSPDLVILERDMPYHEREGESKLNVVKDGLRFLRVIVEAAFLYRPSRPLTVLAGLLAAVAVGLMIGPSLFYLREHRVLEWMIYRFTVAHLAATSAVLLACFAHLMRRMVNLALQSNERPSLTQRLIRGRGLFAVVVALLGLGGWLVLPSLVELLQTGHTDLHWSRFLAMTVFWATAITLVVTRVADFSLDLLEARVEYLRR